MSQELRQSTQVVVHIGTFVDVGDAFTPETGVTLSGADEAEVLKHGATSTTDISGATWAAITGCDGHYALTLTTSHTDTLGNLDVVVQDDSVCLPVKKSFNVISQAMWDAKYGSGNVPADTKAISGSATAADNLERAALGLIPFTVGSGSTSTVIETDLEETTANHYNGSAVTFVTGALAGQRRTITGYASGALTVAAMTEAPSEGDLGVIS